TQTHKEFSSSKWFRTSCYRMAVWLIENGARSQFKRTLYMSQGINSLADFMRMKGYVLFW
ncbi:MAG: hypothetical protein MUD14_17585, partial [Hydrococcus sp. Prado102]|nr:hypothetical protein [Hydrococcus sp. Prado102]